MTPEWTAMQRHRVAAVYDLLAGLLPVEGRDYTITFTFERADGRPHITMNGITPFGKLWVVHCNEEMQKKWGVTDETRRPTPTPDVAAVPQEQSVL